MKKTVAIVAGALAVITAIAALIKNAQTISEATVSAYHWVKGGGTGDSGTATNGNSKHALERIRGGDPFRVKLYKTFGDLGAGQTYYAWYTPSQKKMTVTGFAAKARQPNITNPYPCLDIDRGKISLWGHSFSVEGDEIVDAVEGRSGRICFDDECK
jgi:hypothetical protein